MRLREDIAIGKREETRKANLRRGMFILRHRWLVYLRKICGTILRPRISLQKIHKRLSMLLGY